MPTKPKTQTKKDQDKPQPKPKEISFGDAIKNLDMDEVDFVEGLTNLGIDTVDDQTQPKALTIAAVGLVYAKRSKPEFSWSQIRAKKISEILEIIGENFELPKARFLSEQHIGD